MVIILVILFLIGMNAALRAVARMGIYLGCEVYLIHEVSHQSMDNFIFCI